jgi:hypothetical protein
MRRLYALGDRGIFFGGNGYYTSNMGLPACKKLEEWKHQGRDLKCVEFTARDWICLTANGPWTSNRTIASSRAVALSYYGGLPPKWIAIRRSLDEPNFAKWSELIHRAYDGNGSAADASITGSTLPDSRSGTGTVAGSSRN